jgi:hypothetical protein
MSELNKKENGRRGFLRYAGVALGLLGLGGLTTWLHGRPKDPKQKCINKWVCPPCNKKETCLLPQAYAYRHGRNRVARRNGSDRKEA